MSLLLEKFSFVFLIFMLVWAPLPLASTNTWAVGILALMASGLLITTWLASLLTGRSFRVIYSAWLPLLCIFGFLALISLQAYSGYRPDALLVSYDVYATKIEILLTITYLIIFICTLLLSNSEQRIRKLLWALVFSGAAQALFAIVMMSLAAHYQLFFFDVDHSTRAKGTFGYHNSFAGYMEICIAAGLGLLFGSFKPPQGMAATWKTRMKSALSFLLSSKMPLRLLLILMVIGLVLTRSRMGNAGLMGALVLAMLIALIFVKELRKILAILVVSVIVVDTLIIGQWVGLDKVVERLENTEMATEQASLEATDSTQTASIGPSKPKRREESLEQRVEPAYNAINMFKDKPWAGFGAGTFYTAYPPYKNPNIRGFYEHAHNDYLEILADTGIVGAGLLFVFALTSFVVGIKLLAVPRGVAKGVGFSVVLVLIALIFHSFVDFNLHIPPNAMTLMVLCALPWACRYLHNTR